MKNAFKSHLESRFPKLKAGKSILALSGGRDSMVLAHLLYELNYDFVVAHCNFRLRGKHSDADAVFVKEWAKEHNLQCFVQSFDTKAFVLARRTGGEAQNISIQMAARELRYTWFESLRKEQNCDFVLTAHHASDTAETFLINLSRGTGLDGLLGIPEQNGAVIRPLLSFSRKQIDDYIQENGIQWCEDATNASDKYLRNHLRHHAIPALEEAAPNFMEGLATTLHNLKAIDALLGDYMALVYSKVVTESFDGYQLNISELQQLPHAREVLYELLKDFGFTAWDDVYDLLSAQPGKMILSPTHRLIKDRGVLLLTKKVLEQTTGGQEQKEFYLTEKDIMLEFEEKILTQTSVQHIHIDNAAQAIFAAKDLKYPLTVRKWEEGDSFYPFGMEGKKKLSKYFKDEKFSVLDKENTWLLCNGANIIWVIGHRTDERYRVKTEEGEFVKFELTKK